MVMTMMAAPPPPAACLSVGSREKTGQSRSRGCCWAVTKATARSAAAFFVPPSGEEEEQQRRRKEEEEDAMRLLTEDRWVAEHILPLLTPVEDAWQPSDLLPSFTEGKEQVQFQEEVAELQARAAELPDDLLVCLVGNMVTEEGLPTYMTMANRVCVAGVEDGTGCDEHGWARWLRGWTAEENRHGDLLNRYLYLCGRVDMRQVELTVHHLLRRGMRMVAPTSAYHSFIYGAFQERATFVSHARTARLCRDDPCLARLCGVVAADEKRHEAAYTRAAARLFGADPDGMVRALADRMRAKVTMPGELMRDGRDEGLFDHFSAVARRAGVYTAADYGDMVDHFLRRWAVPDLVLSSGEGRRAQDYVCGLPAKIRRMAEREAARQNDKHEPQSVGFSWVFGRPVRIR
ncbi:hypothetical protein PR202_ga11696 [Eleusine coracana subsp. coracana]|uniref:Uncharacterized protein n=1 Tax=Eleusine coracana subsp. coracana TaxID=191504 RepID=A0AAV5CA54_ELECO|nr:hypothetical protein PR202_ga11696 [Eleusine coracana subsp. coracana]